ncbi:MAG: hypothetical protein H6729_15110 [Deltaproteobacteria bacterium]|nr:hypothetical protein [Deltaproteobacteria bacterium]
MQCASDGKFSRAFVAFLLCSGLGAVVMTTTTAMHRSMARRRGSKTRAVTSTALPMLRRPRTTQAQCSTGG